MDKATVAKILEEISLLLELAGENPFKSRAYSQAARTIATLDEDLRQLVETDTLKKVKGIGTALDQKIKELVQTGKLLYYEELKASIPEGLFQLLRIPGLGPKKVKTLYDTLQISSIAELEYACKENRLIELKGFGIKTQENILKGIGQLKRYQGQYFYSEALSIARKLLESLSEIPGVSQASMAGSIRRCKEVVKDIDLVAASEQPELVIEGFTKLSSVDQVLGAGKTKASVRLDTGINADLRVVAPHEFPYALHHFTGSKEHNTAIRQLAKTKGLKVNEYGIFRGEQLIECADEAGLFETLGMAYIPPELREGYGEIEAAIKGELPKLIDANDIKGIYHVHTTYSDGSNSLEEIVLACRSMGYEYVGISDHSQSAFYANGLQVERLKKQWEEIDKLNEAYPDITILKGIESDIKADGSLDYDDQTLEQLDFVIASVHSGFRMTQEEMTARLIKAMAHPAVTMLGHPTGRLLLGREGYPLDLERVLEAALRHQVAVELNASPARLDLDWRYLKKAKEMGVLIAINPDAHRIGELEDVYYGVLIARKGWLEAKDVLNAGSL